MSLSRSGASGSATSTGRGVGGGDEMSRTMPATPRPLNSLSSISKLTPDSARTRDGTMTSSPPRRLGSIGGEARTVTAQLNSRSASESRRSRPAWLRGWRPLTLTGRNRGSQAIRSARVISGIGVAAIIAGSGSIVSSLLPLHKMTAPFRAPSSRLEHSQRGGSCLCKCCTKVEG